MENKTSKAVKALKEIEAYCNVHCLAELKYAIEVLEKAEKAGIKDLLGANFDAFEKKE